MSELNVKEFTDLISENPAHLLFNEKRNMFGEQEVPPNRGPANRLFTGSLAGLVTK
jgi:hypothetical protein